MVILLKAFVRRLLTLGHLPGSKSEVLKADWKLFVTGQGLVTGGLLLRTVAFKWGVGLLKGVEG